MNAARRMGQQQRRVVRRRRLVARAGRVWVACYTGSIRVYNDW